MCTRISSPSPPTAPTTRGRRAQDMPSSCGMVRTTRRRAGRSRRCPRSTRSTRSMGTPARPNCRTSADASRCLSGRPRARRRRARSGCRQTSSSTSWCRTTRRVVSSLRSGATVLAGTWYSTRGCRPPRSRLLRRAARRAVSCRRRSASSDASSIRSLAPHCGSSARRTSSRCATSPMLGSRRSPSRSSRGTTRSPSSPRRPPPSSWSPGCVSCRPPTQAGPPRGSFSQGAAF